MRREAQANSLYLRKQTLGKGILIFETDRFRTNGVLYTLIEAQRIFNISRSSFHVTPIPLERHLRNKRVDGQMCLGKFYIFHHPPLEIQDSH